MGRAIRYSMFGESHGVGIGAVLDGLPAGIEIDPAEIRRDLDRRKPGASKLSTKRVETDEAEILSGVKDGRTSGGPIAFLIRNADARSSDYDGDLPRPSHADLPAFYKHGGFADMRGGGRFSGRLTAPLVAAGAVARQIMARRGIVAGSHLLCIGELDDQAFGFGEAPNAEQLEAFRAEHLPLINRGMKGSMELRIEKARADMDSVGGRVETAVLGLPPGVGEPPYEGIEGALAAWIFAIPGVKAFESGAGRDFSRMRGSESNDPIALRDGEPRPLSNRSGGVNGGITNGNCLIFSTTMRPTASISVPQRSVRLSSKREEELVVKGRHDPCIVPRAVPVIEAAALLCLLDLLIQAEGPGWMR
jgi:chorismate synthase